MGSAEALVNDRTFIGQWVAANGLAEALGLGTTFVLGGAAAGLTSADQGAAAVLGAALLAIALGVVLEGVFVGLAQGVVLNRRRPDVPLRSWVFATMWGAGLAWTLGMIPSTAVALSAAPAVEATAVEPARPVVLLLAAALGLVTGPVLGVAQWVVIRRRFERAGAWLWANAVAWSVGMTVIFAGMDLVPWDGPAAARMGAIYSTCLVAGVLVGCVHGPVLARLTRTGPRTEER